MPYKETPEEVLRKKLLRELYRGDPGPVETEIRKFVKELDLTDKLKLALAEMAYSLSRTLDVEASNSSAGVSKELREILEKLAETKNDLNDIFGSGVSSKMGNPT